MLPKFVGNEIPFWMRELPEEYEVKDWMQQFSMQYTLLFEPPHFQKAYEEKVLRLSDISWEYGK